MVTMVRSKWKQELLWNLNVCVFMYRIVKLRLQASPTKIYFDPRSLSEDFRLQFIKTQVR